MPASFWTGGGSFVNPVKVVDARMGRGKSSAAIRYMKEHPEERFMYITPFLPEVQRICDACGFVQPEGRFSSKSAELYRFLCQGQSVSCTHELFHHMRPEALEKIREYGYTLIVDEALSVAEVLNVTPRDQVILARDFIDTDETMKATWRDPSYKGKFEEYKEYADSGMLYYCVRRKVKEVDDTGKQKISEQRYFMMIMSPDYITSFKQVYMLTYLFEGQYQKLYMDFYGIPYTKYGVASDEGGFRFVEGEDCPPPINYFSLITIADKREWVSVGEGRGKLSSSWYKRTKSSDGEMKMLARCARNALSGSPAKQTLWTCFAHAKPKLAKNDFRYTDSSYLFITARATNDYRDRTHLAYLVNRYADPRILTMLSREPGSSDGEEIDDKKEKRINGELFALSEMLQWIWRSAIRDNKPITVFVPSARMRRLLLNWMEEVSQGGEQNAEKKM